MAVAKETTYESSWYQTERNTERLIKTVIADREPAALSGEDIWRLIQLTWITAGPNHSNQDHWKRLKVPALAHLYGKRAAISPDLAVSLASMELPPSVSKAAAENTGFVNAYRAYRNSLKGWCFANKGPVISILHSALQLGPNDQDRLHLASAIAELPAVPTPAGKHSMAASHLITPLVACLDPKRRFPIINGESGVKHRLTELGLVNQNLEDQVKGFIGLIGQFDIPDAFAVDTMSKAQMEKIVRQRRVPALPSTPAGGMKLSVLDEAERKALQASKTITYRNRHNKMTNRLSELLTGLTLNAGTNPDCRYDVLVKNYDRNGRDLLIEVKPDPDKGSLRVAIGQLLDYRRFLPNQVATDLAILTILTPPHSYIALMQDLQITSLWFTGEGCRILSGSGKIWKTIEAMMKS